MALTFQSGESIKQALYEELRNLLSPITAIRVASEGRMKQLEITEGYGVFLAEIIMNQSFDFAIRQLASVMLKKYVEEHWHGSDNGIAVIATDQAKKVIRNILPNGLYDPNSKIRTSVAYTISTIATLDWPTTWTELFDIIVKCLGGNEDSIHGAMQVLVEFTYDLYSEISIVAPIIISEVYRIFEADKVYGIKTRTCAVKIFESLFKSINEHIESKEEQAKILNPIIPILIEKFLHSLSETDLKSSSFTLKTEIIKVLDYMVNEMSKFIFPYTDRILPIIWQLLTQTADIYVKVIVNKLEPNPFDDDDEDELSTMILQIIELISSIVEHNKFKSAIKTVLSDLIYIMIVYMQITEDQIETWSDDPEQFLKNDYQEELDTSVRISSNDVLQIISERFGSKILQPLSEALARHVSVAEAEKASGNPHWWKIHEASMTAVGFYSELILEKQTKFDLTQYLNYVRSLMLYQESPYLLARCLWVLSRYTSSEVCNTQTLGEILEAIINGLAQDKPINLRIYAVRSIYELCDTLQSITDDRRTVVLSKLGCFLDGILALVPHNKNIVLSLILETITLIMAFDTNFAASSHNKVIPLIIAIFLKHNDDPFLLSHVQDLLKILSQNPFCLQPLQEKIVPTLVSILNLQGERANNAIQEIALDVLKTVVKYSKAPLNDQLIENAFPAAVHCILRTEDNSIMQSGGECLREFIYVSPQQVCSYKHGEGLNYIMQVTTMLLNPMNSEFTAAFVGRLVVTIISKAGNMIGENIYLLLKAVISKMQLVESLCVAMSLVITFAHLFVTQMEAVLNFLSTVPGPTGEPAIRFVFSNWLCRQHLFFGAYERKVSTMALCKLFEYGVTTKDVRLTSVTIRDLVENNSEVKRRTRSQTAATNENHQWTTIPVLVKILKLLIAELAYMKEAQTIESDDCTDDSEDDDKSEPRQSPIKLSEIMFDDDDEDNEKSQLMEELMQDPIFQTNMEQNLTEFLQNFSRDDHFREFVTHLNTSEKQVLQSIQVII